MKRMKGGFFFPWLHSSMIYLTVYKKIAYYIQQLLPTPRGWRYFTFGREVKIRKGVILRLRGVVEHAGISYTRCVDFIACLGAFGFALRASVFGFAYAETRRRDGSLNEIHGQARV